MMLMSSVRQAVVNCEVCQLCCQRFIRRPRCWEGKLCLGAQGKKITYKYQKGVGSTIAILKSRIEVRKARDECLSLYLFPLLCEQAAEAFGGVDWTRDSNLIWMVRSRQYASAFQTRGSGRRISAKSYCFRIHTVKLGCYLKCGIAR